MLEDEDMQDRQTQANDKEEVGDPNSLLGSDRSLYGGNSDLLVHQFELHSRVYQKHQITLLEVSLTYCNPLDDIVIPLSPPLLPWSDLGLHLHGQRELQ